MQILTRSRARSCPLLPGALDGSRSAVCLAPQADLRRRHQPAVLRLKTPSKVALGSGTTADSGMVAIQDSLFPSILHLYAMSLQGRLQKAEKVGRC